MHMFVELYTIFRNCRVFVSSSRYDLANSLGSGPLLEQRKIFLVFYKHKLKKLISPDILYHYI